MAQGGRGMGGRSRTAFPGGMGWGGECGPKFSTPRCFTPAAAPSQKKPECSGSAPSPNCGAALFARPDFTFTPQKESGGHGGDPRKEQRPQRDLQSSFAPKMQIFPPKPPLSPLDEPRGGTPSVPCPPPLGTPHPQLSPPSAVTPLPPAVGKLKIPLRPPPRAGPTPEGFFLLLGQLTANFPPSAPIHHFHREI